ncbi:sensor histidine kinase [Mucisphaera sp.]|uniref:sensor histidine kinase n=1 Tax=Mucisphaera sp. TaxID=2913024 RepID=UPI003D0AFF3E
MSYSDPSQNGQIPRGFPSLGADPSGGVGGQALAFLDRAERSLAELEEAASPWLRAEGLGLAAVLAHEINNLLTPVSLYTARAKRSPEDPELGLRALEEAERLVERVGRLTETVLSLAKGDEQGGEVSCLAIEAAREAADELRPELEGLCLDLSGIDQGLVVPMERSALERVLVNLGRNAIRAMRREGTGSRIVFDGSEAGGRITLNVIDDGPGLEGELASSMFEAWSRGEGGSHGLGLSLCRELVVRRGGSLSYEAAEPTGCVFSITF